MADIFISYAREDLATAQRLAEALAQQGWSVWWDPDIHPGETWDEVIERELDAALCVTVLWPQRSIQKDWVRVEATEGLERRILVPALIEDVKPPLRFRRVQAAPLMAWNGEQGHRGFEQLLKALSAELGAPPRPQTSVPKQAPAEKTPEPEPVPEPSKPSLTEAAKKSSAPEDLLDFAVFRDVDEPWCPEMVVLPTGEFLMGSSDTDKESLDSEKPQHKVTVGYRGNWRRQGSPRLARGAWYHLQDVLRSVDRGSIILELQHSTRGFWAARTIDR